MAARNLQVHKPYPRSGCPHCGMAARGQIFKNGEQTCCKCGNLFSAEVFALPPEKILLKSVTHDVSGTGIESAQNASCAKHALNAASANCERCGNFVCALCRTPLAGKDYCPACFERLLEEGKTELPPAHETFYAGVAAVLTLVGLMPPLGLVLGPAGVYYGIRGFRQARRCRMPLSTVINALLSVVLGLLNTLICWGGLAVLIFLMVTKTKW